HRVLTARSSHRRRTRLCPLDRLTHSPASVTATVHCLPGLGRCLIIRSLPTRRSSDLILHRSAAACVTGRRRGEGRCGRALNGSVAALTADRRRRRVCYRNRLVPRGAVVTASVHRVPGPGLGVSASTSPSRSGVAVLHYRGSAARITGRRSGEGRRGRTLNGGIAARSANRRRSGVAHRDRLSHSPAGVTATVHCLPALG